MSLKRIDAIDINYVDSAADKSLKVGESKGMGESRLYCGHDEQLLDEFFDLDNIDCFFMLKDDLKTYLEDAKDEYLNPSREYKENISLQFDEKVLATNEIDKEQIKIYYRKKYDSANRYYLVLKEDRENRKNYSFLRNICLPRMTVITFVKLEDEETHKLFIYFKPIFYIDPTKRDAIDEAQEISDQSSTETEKLIKEKYRKKQTQYRLALLDNMPACLITGVSDDRLLVACHVKPYCECTNDDEKYDVKNGIILTPTYHTLFDLGFISFNSEGRLLVSPFLSNLNKKRLQLIENTAYRLQNGTEKYMKYHREHVFNTIKFDEINFVD